MGYIELRSDVPPPPTCKIIEHKPNEHSDDHSEDVNNMNKKCHIKI